MHLMDPQEEKVKKPKSHKAHKPLKEKKVEEQLPQEVGPEHGLVASPDLALMVKPKPAPVAKPAAKPKPKKAKPQPAPPAAPAPPVLEEPRPPLVDQPHPGEGEAVLVEDPGAIKEEAAPAPPPLPEPAPVLALPAPSPPVAAPPPAAPEPAFVYMPDIPPGPQPDAPPAEEPAAEAAPKKRLRRREKKAKKEKPLKPEKAPRKTRPRHELLFSEAHPGAYGMARSLLPRLQTLILAVGLLVAAMLELMHKNMDFLMDWYHDSYIGPALKDILTQPNGFQIWWSQYGPVFVVVCLIITMLLVTFYVAFWRMFFRGYLKRSEGSTTREGRCYWRSNNSWTRLWDRIYRSPERKLQQYWIHTGWLPLFNPFNPPGCMICVETASDEKCEQRGLYNILVNERPIRRMIAEKKFRSMDALYESGPIPTEYVESEFQDRSTVLIDDTMHLSFGNAENRNRIMQDGLRLNTPKLRERILNGRDQGKA